MRTVSGTGNWILTIEEKGDEITVLRALTCDADAELPETVFGKSITRLSNSALAVKDFDPEGEKVRITCGKPDGEFDNRSLGRLTLPATLKSCGNYTFAGCRKLETLRVTDSIEVIGAGSFMNCMSLELLEVKRQGEVQGTVVYEFVSEFSRELEVRITGENGAESRFIFPEYFEVRTENEPTHFFTYTIEGAGYPYHNCFSKKRFFPGEYDRLWERYISSGCEEKTAVRLAWLRVRYPDELSDEARGDYLGYLGAHSAELLRLIIEERDARGLRIALESCRADQASLEAARGKAADAKFTEATVILLEKQHELFPGKSRNNEL